MVSLRGLSLVVLSILFVWVESSIRLHAQTYRITDLGALPGNTTAKAYGLNNLGQAVGTSDSGAATATLFSNGTVTNMNTLNASVSVATCIGGSGQAAGYNIFYSNPSPTFRAFVYSNGSMTDIQSDSLFPSGTQAHGINSSGTVVGIGWVNNNSYHFFLYTGGQMIDLGYPAWPCAINDAGQIVGTNGTSTVAFLYSNGKMISLGFPAGTDGSSAEAIDSTGKLIAGALYFANGPSHAALYNNGTWVDLGAFPGATSGNVATGVNRTAQVVGNAFFPVKSYHPFRPGKHVPFIYHNGALVDLNTLGSSNPGFTITDTIGINDSGQILCNATNSSGVQRAVMLNPK
jgi:probable HAF family extracellular repeat protein